MKQVSFIAPSILSANFAKLGEDVQAVIDAGADIIHFDVMDNHYVPNLSFGSMILKSLKKSGITARIDVHLMAKPVDRLIEDFLQEQVEYITFHPEACEHIDRTLQVIKQGNCKAGIAINPATSLHCLDYILDKIEMILLMAVNPGFGGQAFIPNTLHKINTARQLIDKSGFNIRLSVDGGVTLNNLEAIAKAGADTFVAGSAIFNSPNYSSVIKTMKNILQNI